MDLSDNCAMRLEAGAAVNKISTNEYRKVIKPLLERRRRARINQCLTELKNLILDTVKHQNLEPSKLEKADILELTVKHLHQLRRHQRGVMVPATSPVTDQDRYRAGFTECAREVSHYVSSTPGMHHDIKLRLLSHLDRCSSNVETTQTSSSLSMSTTPTINTPPPSPSPSDASYVYNAPSPMMSDTEDSLSSPHPLNLSAKLTVSVTPHSFHGHLMTSPIGHYQTTCELLTPVSPNGHYQYNSNMESTRPVAPWRPW